MNLTETTTPARVQHSGYDNDVIVSAGQTIKIETTPGGVEILNVVVPAGKQWSLNVSVDVRETDV